MPIYDYICSACANRVEVVHGIHGHGPLACPSCGAEGTMKKAFVPPAIHFKGSGWAKKDRAATSSPGTTSRPKTEKGASETGAAKGGSGSTGTTGTPASAETSTAVGATGD
jgi:putative FmdB family regulatory protein